MNPLKKMFKGKKASESVPRPMEVIRQQYQSLAMQAGALQYEIEVKKSELNNINSKLLELNQEGDARNKLDQAAAKAVQGKENETAKS